jgi:hypothetical protein
MKQIIFFRTTTSKTMAKVVWGAPVKSAAYNHGW